MKSAITAHYYFKLKHDIQNDSELALAKLEVERLMGKHAREIINFVEEVILPHFFGETLTTI